MPNAPLTKIYLPTGKKVKYVYDALNRLGEKGIVTDEDEYFSELYSYEEGGYREYTVYNSLLKNNISPLCLGGVCGGGSTGGGGETNPPVTVIRPDRKTTFVSEMEFRGLNLTDKYEYDKNGNISKRTIGGKEIRYTYDDIDRLIREDNWLSELVNSKVNMQIYAIKYLVNVDNNQWQRVRLLPWSWAMCGMAIYGG